MVNMTRTEDRMNMVAMSTSSGSKAIHQVDFQIKKVKIFLEQFLASILLTLVKPPHRILDKG
jgi:hypothetical protein